MAVEPIYRRTWEAERLLREHPPRWRNPNKRAVAALVEAGPAHAGRIGVARWPARPLPADLPEPRAFRVEAGLMDYGPEPDGATVSWYMNFADPVLFVAYEGALLAQDELQVLEHPALGAVREALRAEGLEAATEARDGSPTPVTVTGVQRRCAFDTRPEPDRPRGLYGNAFAAAPAAAVRAATRLLDPPTLSNLLAIAAPSGGWGAYTREEVQGILETAFSGFAAAAQEGERRAGGPVRTVVHTGFWGCGAFGGHRDLMTLLQALAADLAGVDLVFHAVDAAGARQAGEAHGAGLGLRRGARDLSGLLDRIARAGYLWGESDGT